MLNKEAAFFNKNILLSVCLLFSLIFYSCDETNNHPENKIIKSFLVNSITTSPTVINESNQNRAEEKKKIDFSNYKSIDKLPSDFQANNIVDVYAHLSEIIPIKSEFETNAEYQKKIKTISINDIYGFLLEPTSKKVNISYNAENKTIIIKLLGKTRKCGWYSILLSRDELQYGSYVGSNAFGVTKEINKMKISNHYIAFKNVSGLVLEKEEYGDDYKINFKFSLEPQIAEELVTGNKLAIFLLCKPILVSKPPETSDVLSKNYDAKWEYRGAKTDPFFVYSSAYELKPTIDNPREGYAEYNYINSALLEIWILNVSTGDIIKKFSVGQIKGNKHS